MTWSPATGMNPGLPSERGTLTSWSGKGFGFISCDSGGQDLFLYADNIRDLDMKVRAKTPGMGLQRGMRLAFDIQKLQGSIRRGKDAGQRRSLAVHVVPLPADKDIEEKRRANSTREIRMSRSADRRGDGSAAGTGSGRWQQQRGRSRASSGSPEQVRQRWKSQSAERRPLSRSRSRSRNRDRDRRR